MVSSKAQMDSPEEEINLNFEIFTKIAMKVERSETIKNLKVMLREKEGISEDVHMLFFAGVHLRDGQRILDYGIPGNSTVHIVHRESSQMILYFKMPSNEKTIKHEVQKGDTIQKIKYIIQDKEGIRPHDFEIYSSGRLIENHRTVASLNIQSKDALQIISNPKDTRSVYVHRSWKSGGCILFQSMINIRSHRMKLFINGTGD